MAAAIATFITRSTDISPLIDAGRPLSALAEYLIGGMLQQYINSALLATIYVKVLVLLCDTNWRIPRLAFLWRLDSCLSSGVGAGDVSCTSVRDQMCAVA